MMIGAAAAAHSFMNGCRDSSAYRAWRPMVMSASVSFAWFRRLPRATVGALPGRDGYAMAAAVKCRSVAQRQVHGEARGRYRL
jgi:hypothetical protein